MKSVGIPALVGGGLAIIGCTWAAAAHQKELALTDQRLQLIRKHAPTGKTKWIFFRGSSHRLGKPVFNQREVKVSLNDIESDPKKSVADLHNRFKFISNRLGGTYHFGEGAIFCGNPPNRLQVQYFVLYGVEAVEYKDSFGRTRYYAIRPLEQTASSTAVTDLNVGSPPFPAYLDSKLHYEDFSNADDVNWMLGTIDFSLITYSIEE